VAVAFESPVVLPRGDGSEPTQKSRQPIENISLLPFSMTS
jgi:hypothetical protein